MTRLPNRPVRESALGLLLAVLLLLLANPVLAQETAAGSASDETEPDEAPFEDVITVTALKGEPISLLEAPVAVTAFSGEELEERGVDSLADFIQEAPGVSLVPVVPGFLNVQIRGVSPNLGDSVIGYYVDEIPYRRLGSTVLPDFGFFDLERVEVLRGPQGTLYGAGSTGGVIRLLTRKPQLEGFSLHGDVGYSSSEDGESTSFGNLAVNAPLGNRVGLRLTGSIHDQGGYIDYPVLGQEDANDAMRSLLRGKFLVEVNAATAITLSATHFDSEADSQTTSDRDWVSNKGLLERSDATDDLYNVDFSWVGPRFSLLSSTSAVESSLLTTNDFLGFPFILENSTDSFVQEIRLNSTTGEEWHWTAGAYYADRDQERLQDATAVLGPFAFARERDTAESLAVFGNLTRSFAEGRAQVSVGGRYWEEDKSIADLVDATAARGKLSFDDFSPRFSLSLFPNPDNSFYFNVSKGFRSGLLQSPIQVFFANLFGVQLAPGTDPETLWAYELGYKSRLAGGKVLFEAAAYHNDWEDILTNVLIIRNVSSSFLNAGSATMSGIEFALDARLNNAVSFGLSGQWNESEFSETVEIQVFDPAVNMFVSEVVVAEGAPISQVPQTTLDADLQVQHYFGELRGFAILRGSYTDERAATGVGGQVFSDEVTRFDLRLGVDAERWGVHLFVNNLTNEDGITTVVLGADPGHAYAPRAIGVNLKFRPWG